MYYSRRFRSPKHTFTLLQDSEGSEIIENHNRLLFDLNSDADFQQLLLQLSCKVVAEVGADVVVRSQEHLRLQLQNLLLGEGVKAPADQFRNRRNTSFNQLSGEQEDTGEEEQRVLDVGSQL